MAMMMSAMAAMMKGGKGGLLSISFLKRDPFWAHGSSKRLWAKVWYVWSAFFFDICKCQDMSRFSWVIANMNTLELETCWMNHRPLGHKAWILLCFFFWDEHFEPKRSQGQRVAAKDLRVLNMARKVGYFVGCWKQIPVGERVCKKNQTPPQKSMFFFSELQSFSMSIWLEFITSYNHNILWFAIWVVAFCRRGKPVSAGTSPGVRGLGLRQVPAIPRQIQSGLGHVLDPVASPMDTS